MKWLSLILKALFTALFGQVGKAVDEARDDAAHHDLGASRQKQADTEAAVSAKAKADGPGLAPADTEKTKGRLRKGEF
jgi:hypothetical protein